MTIKILSLLDFQNFETPDIRISSYKNLGYPMGCSATELKLAMGNTDFVLRDSSTDIVGYTRLKAVFEQLCYFDFHLLKAKTATPLLEVFLDKIKLEFDVGKFYVQLFPYEHIEINCLLELGFTEEACLTKHVFVDGQYVDLLMLGSKDSRV